MIAQLETLDEIQEGMSAEQMARHIRDFTALALAELSRKKDASYAAACAPLDEELSQLAGESGDIQARSQAVLERLASAERVKRFEADRLVMEGKIAEAAAKLRELEEIETAPAKIEARRREIAEHCEQIEGEKRTARRRAAEEFRDGCFALIRGSETALSTALNETMESLNQLETQTGKTLYRIPELTAGERTAEWFTLHRHY